MLSYRTPLVLLRPNLLLSIFSRSSSRLAVAAKSNLTNEDPDFYVHLLLSFSRRLTTTDAHHLFDERPQTPVSCCRAIHARVLRLGFPLLGKFRNVLVDLYSKLGQLPYAQKLLDEMPDRDVTPWNSILQARSRMGLLEDVLQTFSSLRSSGVVLLDQFSFAIVLSGCAKLAAVHHGKLIHSDALKMGFACGLFCGGALVDMYAKCGHVDDARRVFDETRSADTVTWTTMIAGYVQSGMPEEALDLFGKMLEGGGVPDRVTLVTVISACLDSGRFQDAEDLFMKMPYPNDVAWNAMISGCARNRHELGAIGFFGGMRRAGFRPTRSTLGSLLSAVVELESLDMGLQIHSLSIKMGLDANDFIGSSLISTYSKLCVVEDARKVFDSLDEKNIVTWNAMLGGFVHNERPVQVLELFFEMKERGIQFDGFTYVSLFAALACLGDIELGRQLHALVIKNNFAERVFVGNSIIDMYAKSEDIDGAERQFMCMPARDIVTWNALVVGLVCNENNDEALNHIRLMRSSGLFPDTVSLASVLSACASKEASQEGKQLHCLSVKLGIEQNMYVGSSIINFYAKSGEMESAEMAYILMPDKSVESRNALIEGYVLNNDPDEALNCFWQMLIEGIYPTNVTLASVLSACTGPHASNVGLQLHCYLLKSGMLLSDVFLGVSLLKMYLRSKNQSVVDRLLMELPCTGNPVLWTIIISNYNENNAEWDSLSLFSKMRHHDAFPDQATFVSVLRACANLAASRNGKELHGLVIRMGYHSDISICCSLIDMYSKCGDVEEARRIFNETENKSSTVLWNSILVGFAKNGFAENALILFRQMEQSNTPLDDISFLGVITACNYAGRVAEGRAIFDDMTKKYGVKPRYDHYVCMVDLLGRGGLLEEAEALTREMPFESDGVIWSTIASSCKLHGDHARAGRAAENLMKLDPQNSSSYVFLSNMCAVSGNWDGVRLVRGVMNENEIRKLPGCSWIVVGDNTTRFVSADTSHPDAINIYETLSHLTEFISLDDHEF